MVEVDMKKKKLIYTWIMLQIVYGVKQERLKAIECHCLEEETLNNNQ